MTQIIQQLLETMLSSCRVRIAFALADTNSGNEYEGDAGFECVQIHLMGTDEHVLTGPGLVDSICLHSGDLIVVFTQFDYKLRAAQEPGDRHPRDHFTPRLHGEIQLLAKHAVVVLRRLPSYLIVRAADASEHLRALAEVLRDCIGQADSGRELVASGLCSALLKNVICEHTCQQWSGITDARIVRVLTAIQDCPYEDWKVRSLAGLAGMSRSTFAQRFSLTTGVPPMRYVTLCRVARAKRLLQQTELSVARVAEMSGYTSEAAFRKLFKRVEGVGPGRVRLSGAVTARTLAIEASMGLTSCDISRSGGPLVRRRS